MQYESLPNTGLMCQSSETCEPSDGTIYQQPTLFAVDSLVSPIASPESATHLPTSATYGENLPVLFAKLSPDMSWLRMYQGYSQARVDGSLVEYSGTWPRAGMMRNGKLYQRVPLVQHIHESACSLWPTPQVGMIRAEYYTVPTSYRHFLEKRQIHITQVFRDPRMWHPSLPQSQAFNLMPCTFAECLMGFPEGWSDLED
jgi:hypothetical protein